LRTKLWEIFFCVHGGIGPEFSSLSNLEDVNRYGDPPNNGLMNDLLWADPAKEDQTTPFIFNESRGTSWFFNRETVETLLKNIDCVCMLRGHEVQKTGYFEHYFDKTKEERKIPYVITLFSAPNYCDKYENKGAYLEITDTEYKIHDVQWEEHPYYLPGWQNAINFTLPFLAECMFKFCTGILNMVSKEDDEDNSSVRIRNKVSNLGKLMLMMKRKRQTVEDSLESLQSFQTTHPDAVKNGQIYEVAFQEDVKNEALPVILRNILTQQPVESSSEPSQTASSPAPLIQTFQ